MADGNSPPQELIQQYNIRITQGHIDILKDEGLIPVSGATLFEIQQGMVAKELQGEVTRSSAVNLPAMGDNRAGTTRTVNNDNYSSGSLIGFGQWIGSFSGSADFFRSGSGFDAFHFTHFSGAFDPVKQVNIGSISSGINYGKVFVGAPDDLTTTIISSSGLSPGNQQLLIPKAFSGSFSSSGAFHTSESGSASGSDYPSAGTSNAYIPGGTFTAKWVSGSFNQNTNLGAHHSYANNPDSMSVFIRS